MKTITLSSLEKREVLPFHALGILLLHSDGGAWAVHSQSLSLQSSLQLADQVRLGDDVSLEELLAPDDLTLLHHEGHGARHDRETRDLGEGLSGDLIAVVQDSGGSKAQGHLGVLVHDALAEVLLRLGAVGISADGNELYLARHLFGKLSELLVAHVSTTVEGVEEVQQVCLVSVEGSDGLSLDHLAGLKGRGNLAEGRVVAVGGYINISHCGFRE